MDKFKCYIIILTVIVAETKSINDNHKFYRWEPIPELDNKTEKQGNNFFVRQKGDNVDDNEEDNRMRWKLNQKGTNTKQLNETEMSRFLENLNKKKKRNNIFTTTSTSNPDEPLWGTVQTLNYFITKRMKDATTTVQHAALKLYSGNTEESDMFKKSVDLHYTLFNYIGIPWKNFGQPCVVGRVPFDSLQSILEQMALNQVELIKYTTSNASNTKPFLPKTRTYPKNQEWNEERFRQDPEQEILLREAYEKQMFSSRQSRRNLGAGNHIAINGAQDELLKTMQNHLLQQKELVRALDDICSHAEYLICVPDKHEEPSTGNFSGRCACRDGFVEENHQCFVPLLEDCSRNNLFLSHDLQLLPRELLDQIKTPKCAGDLQCLNDFVCSSATLHIISTALFYLCSIYFALFSKMGLSCQKY